MKEILRRDLYVMLWCILANALMIPLWFIPSVGTQTAILITICFGIIVCTIAIFILAFKKINIVREATQTIMVEKKEDK